MYWAVLSSTIVLHTGIDRGSATLRAAHRITGTCLGVLAVAAIETLHPPRPAELALMLVGVLGTNLPLPRHYSLAVICVTLMAMMAKTTSDPALPVPALLADRLEETAIGVLDRGCAADEPSPSRRRRRPSPRIATARTAHAAQCRAYGAGVPLSGGLASAAGAPIVDPASGDREGRRSACPSVAR
ncbi:FUSC family protein [Streptomyces sp. NPDC127172]|uniref:FUSC family protein n=1 Tax=Streptomyces sp. NPDC127172 TaxID=3345382 RepID=UPI0036413EE3